ncbi:sugar-transfer associated ATP-grasp domain-containing protein [Anaerovoracaceae bacterium SGI.195]
MKYIVMADGGGQRWNNYMNVPKHLLKYKNETLLHRTCRLLKRYDPNAEIIITSHNKDYDLEGTTRYEPKNNVYEVDRFTVELIEDNVCFLYGDVIYTYESIEKIVNKCIGDVMFFGNKSSIVAIKIFKSEKFLKHFNKVRSMCESGEISNGKGWQVYQSYADLEIGEKIVVGDYFFNVGKNVIDINTPEEYETIANKNSSKDSRLKKKIKRKCNIVGQTVKYVLKGYPYFFSKKWGRLVHKDLISKGPFSKQEKKQFHKHGFLSSSLDKYKLNGKNYDRYISDFDITFITPLNNAYEKWLTDGLTPYLITKNFSDVFGEVAYSIMQRNGRINILDLQSHLLVEPFQLLNKVREEGPYLLSPSDKKYKEYSYLIEWNDEFQRPEINGELSEVDEFVSLIKSLKRYYYFQKYYYNDDNVLKSTDITNPIFQFTIVNEAVSDKGRIVSAKVINERGYRCGIYCSERLKDHKTIRNIENGIVDGSKIPYWEIATEKLIEFASSISEIECFTIYAKIVENDIKIQEVDNQIYLDQYDDVDSEIYKYLKKKVDDKHARKKKGQLKNATHPIIYRIKRKIVKKFFRKGFREYMAMVWLHMVWDDLWYTKLPLKTKIWAWKRGFASYRIQQYGLTEDNWKFILSDYDYAWLNRMNNVYQKWVNDKTTMRYILDSEKSYVPEYYYFVGKKDNMPFIKPLQDLPEEYVANTQGILKCLRDKEKLVFKPNAGTHGDGFYAIEYSEGEYLVNGETFTEDKLIKIIEGQRSTYVVTEYVEMHHLLRRIYPKSVNTIRIMVINKNFEEPKIMHAYMRIGSEKTGYTDNVGYGGVCCYVDVDTGRYYGGEIIENHKFVPCPTHPDTGVKIEGILPNWEIVKSKLIEVSSEISQLEYLGYDIAITEESFKILEINIHQDLHKYIRYPDEVKLYFLNKMETKRKLCR